MAKSDNGAGNSAVWVCVHLLQQQMKVQLTDRIKTMSMKLVRMTYSTLHSDTHIHTHRHTAEPALAAMKINLCLII